MQALEGIRVLDCSRVLAGPFCSMQLGDYGAEILKIEHPLLGDDTRHWGPPFQGQQSAYFLSSNRNKHSIGLDFQHPKGREILIELVKKSDVFLENLKANSLKKWGLDYESLAKINPALVYCSITGYGYNNSCSSLAGYDFAIQAEAGLMSITGEPDGSPQKVGVAVVDILTGLFAVSSILAALFHRNQTGEGQWIDLSLLDAQLGSLANIAQNALCTGKVPVRGGNSHPNIVPYQLFHSKTSDFVLAVGNDSQYKKLTNVLNQRELWEDQRFQTNAQRVEHREELCCRLQAILYQKSSQEWIAQFRNQGIPSAPVQNIQEMLSSQWVTERKMIQSIVHPLVGNIQQISPVAKLSKTPATITKAPPLLGEDTFSVLQKLLQISQEELLQLSEQNILSKPF